MATVCGAAVVLTALAVTAPALAGWNEGGNLILDLGQGSRLSTPSYVVRPGGHDDALVPRSTWALRLDAGGDTASVRLLSDSTASMREVLPDGGGGSFVLLAPNRPYPVVAPLRVARVSSPGVAAPGWPDSGVTVFGMQYAWGQTHLCLDGSGGVFVAWSDARDGVGHVMRVNHVDASGRVAVADGVSALETVVHVYDSGPLVPDGDGGAIVTIREQVSATTGSYALFAQRVDATCARKWGAGGARLGQSDAYRLPPAVVDDGLGGAFFAWRQGWSTPAVRGMHVLADGSVGSGWDGVEGSELVPPDAPAQAPLLGPDGAGGFYLAWVGGSPGSLLLSRRAPDGTACPGWTVEGMLVGEPDSDPSAALLADPLGAWLVWTAGTAAWAARVDAAGPLAPGWSARLAEESGEGSVACLHPAVVADGAGGAFAFWQRCEDLLVPQEVVTANLLYAARLAGDGLVDVLATLLDVEATATRVRLEWWVSEGMTGAVLVERCGGGADWARIGEAAPAGDSRWLFEDPAVSPGSRYGYRLALVTETGTLRAGEAWVEVPAAAAFALSGPRPDPAAGPLRIAFSLPDAAPARLEVFDLAGRRLRCREVGGMGAGSHTISFAGSEALPPGTYLLRLERAGRSLTAHGVVLR